MINQIVQKMIEQGLATERELLGCSVTEIENLEAKYEIKLPESYKKFLMKMGKNSGRLVDPNEFAIDYNSVMKMTEERRQQIDDCKLELKLELESASALDKAKLELEEIIEIPDKTLLVLCRLPSCEFYLIEANGGDDSPVFYYDDEGIVKEFESFWDILKMFITGLQISS
jgi:SMI1 / KNR4 family (SUKH-1)